MSLFSSFTNTLLRRPVLQTTLNRLQVPQLSPWQQLTRSFASKKHKNLLKYSKGYRGRSKNCFRVAIRRVEKAWQYAYRDRRVKKRNWRKLWIQRIQAGARQYGIRYSAFIPALNRSNIALNRKVLAEMAANEPFAFKSVLDTVKASTHIA
mmetsp:Transcript_12746/g.24491  ORF Transcript_12746/g.24491 Transcript_12746/m.24491 type:complete len:151 (+) Transcript_12746:25-477(+)